MQMEMEKSRIFMGVRHGSGFSHIYHAVCVCRGTQKWLSEFSNHKIENSRAKVLVRATWWMRGVCVAAYSQATEIT